MSGTTRGELRLQRIVRSTTTSARVGRDVRVVPAERRRGARHARMPSGFQVMARFRKLLRGSPSASVSTLTRIRPSSASVIRRVGVDRMERLLLVRHCASARRWLRGGRSTGWSAAPRRSRCVDGDVRVLSPSGENGAVTIAARCPCWRWTGDVVDAEPPGALGDVEVLAAQLAGSGPPLAWSCASIAGSLRPRFSCCGVPVGIGVPVQIAADHRLRLVPFGDAHRLDRAAPRRPRRCSPTKLTKLVPCSSSCAMIALLSLACDDVAVAAGLGLGLALGVRIVRRERLRGEARRRDRRLLRRRCARG